VIEVPKEASIHKIEIEDLPSNWNASSYPQEMEQISEGWVKEGKHLLMRVLSVHSPLEL
jgi:hypothetical protein